VSEARTLANELAARAERGSRHDPVSYTVSPRSHRGRQGHLPLLLDSDEQGRGISNNPRHFWDIQHARRVLGYDPQDAAPALIGDEDGSDALDSKMAKRQYGR
jgi:hypothetical protein